MGFCFCFWVFGSLLFCFMAFCSVIGVTRVGYCVSGGRLAFIRLGAVSLVRPLRAHRLCL